uniref:Secreted protein n=1 Tax=Anguilla anguilla TaxID=7936 RepID=A0A0E9WU12_ANGAN
MRSTVLMCLFSTVSSSPPSALAVGRTPVLDLLYQCRFSHNATNLILFLFFTSQAMELSIVFMFQNSTD